MSQRDFAIQIAKEAGKMIKEDFALSMQRRLKPDDETYVTDTDKKINKMVIGLVRKEYPAHDIISEEGSHIANRSANRWVCDPVDGTISFSHGVPICAFSLALVVEGMPHIGVVYDPFGDRMFHAEIGKGAFLDGKRIKVSRESRLRNSVVGFSHWKNPQFNLAPLYENLTDNSIGANVLVLGSITYMGALVSCGEFAANVHAARLPYDSAALKVIIEEAGGKVTDLFGIDQRYDGLIRGCIMSNGVVHQELVGLVRQAIDR